MLKHIVLFKLKGSNGGRIDLRTAQRMKSELEALKGKIEEIRFLEVGFDLTGSNFSYDIALYSEFDDEAGLRRYQRNPHHVKVAEFVTSVSETRAVVDYVV